MHTCNYMYIVMCPTPLLEKEGSGDTWGISVADWNEISATMAWVLSHDRKNDVVQLPWQESSDNPYFLFPNSFDIVATGASLRSLTLEVSTVSACKGTILKLQSPDSPGECCSATRAWRNLIGALTIQRYATEMPLAHGFYASWEPTRWPHPQPSRV